MHRSSWGRSARLFAMGVALALLAPNPLTAAGVRITPIGRPIWKPVDFQLFSAPVGTEESGYAEANVVGLEILKLNHVPDPDLGVGPGAPHPPPYDSELDEGLEAKGYHEGVQFRARE